MEYEKGQQQDTSGLSPEYSGLIQYIQDSAQNRGKSGGEDSGEKIVTKRSWLTPWKKETYKVDKSGNLVKDTGARVTPEEWCAPFLPSIPAQQGSPISLDKHFEHRLDTDMRTGLSDAEVQKRRSTAGWNELEA